MITLSLYSHIEKVKRNSNKNQAKIAFFSIRLHFSFIISSVFFLFFFFIYSLFVSKNAAKFAKRKKNQIIKKHNKFQKFLFLHYFPEFIRIKIRKVLKNEKNSMLSNNQLCFGKAAKVNKLINSILKFIHFMILMYLKTNIPIKYAEMTTLLSDR